MSTTTDMKPGTWLDGYQAVSPAPVDLAKGDRHRYIDGKLIKGAWSDPWWMYDPDRGWAVARRWRNKAQRIFAWPESRSEDFPALEEREVTPWTPTEPAGSKAAEADDAATVRVWDIGTDETREVTVPEAAAGMVRYARTLGPGTPACGEVERKAVELLRNGAETMTGGEQQTPQDAMTRAAAVREEARRHREAQLAAMRQRAAERRAARTETTGVADVGIIGTAIAADRALQRRQDAKQEQAAAVPSGAPAAYQPAGTVAQEPRIPGDQLLDLLASGWFGHYARFPSPAALDAVTLWAAHAHMRDENGMLVFRATPRLYLLSSEPGSGKSFALELVGRVVPAWYGLDLEPTAPGLVHTISKEHATVTLDEADIMLGAGGRHEAVRAVINGGTYRFGTVLNGRGAKANRVPVFGPLALAGLDSLEKNTGDKLAALLSRGVKIRMEKASGENRPPKLTKHGEDAAGKAKMWLERWAAQVRDEVAAAEPEIPEGIEGRTEDIWAPLLAVAQAAGGSWPERARAACLELALGKPDGGENLEAKFAEFASEFAAR